MLARPLLAPAAGGTDRQRTLPWPWHGQSRGPVARGSPTCTSWRAPAAAGAPRPLWRCSCNCQVGFIETVQQPERKSGAEAWSLRLHDRLVELPFGQFFARFNSNCAVGTGLSFAVTGVPEGGAWNAGDGDGDDTDTALFGSSPAAAAATVFGGHCQPDDGGGGGMPSRSQQREGAEVPFHRIAYFKLNSAIVWCACHSLCPGVLRGGAGWVGVLRLTSAVVALGASFSPQCATPTPTQPGATRWRSLPGVPQGVGAAQAARGGPGNRWQQQQQPAAWRSRRAWTCGAGAGWPAAPGPALGP